MPSPIYELIWAISRADHPAFDAAVFLKKDSGINPGTVQIVKSDLRKPCGVVLLWPSASQTSPHRVGKPLGQGLRNRASTEQEDSTGIRKHRATSRPVNLARRFGSSGHRFLSTPNKTSLDLSYRFGQTNKQGTDGGKDEGKRYGTADNGRSLLRFVLTAMAGLTSRGVHLLWTGVAALW